MTQPEAMKVEQLAIHLVIIGEQQIRHGDDDDQLDELALDMQRNGLMQPIGVTPNADGTYQLNYGSRRLRAARRLRWTHIPAVIRTNDTAPIRTTAARENLHRRQLTIAEQAAVVLEMYEKENRSPNDIAAALGKTRAWVLRRIAYNTLPPDLQDALEQGTLSLGVAEQLARIVDADKRTWLLNICLRERYTERQATLAVDGIQPYEQANDAAVAAASHAHAQLLLGEALRTCSACQKPKPIGQLAMIYVCKDGCEPPDGP